MIISFIKSIIYIYFQRLLFKYSVTRKLVSIVYLRVQSSEKLKLNKYFPAPSQIVKSDFTFVERNLKTAISFG